MSQACSGGSDGQATRRNAGALWATDRLALAASPTFAIMALLTGVLGAVHECGCSCKSRPALRKDTTLTW